MRYQITINKRIGVRFTTMKKLFILFSIQYLSFSIFAQSISLDPNSLQLPRLAVSPTCAVADKGKMIYNTSQEKVLYCNGTTWIDPTTGGVPNNWVNAGYNSYLSNLIGNVGIGTSSPTYTLDILHGGQTGIRVKSSSWYSVVDIDAANGDGSLRFFKDGVKKWALNSTPSNDFQIYQFDNSTRLFIQSTNGNVGIGTTSPSQKLHVAGSAVVDGNLKVNSGNGIVRSDDATQMMIQDYATPPNINFSLAAGAMIGPISFGFSTFTSSPSISFGDTIGITNPQNLVFTIESVTTSGASIWVKNIGSSTSVATNGVIKAMIIGKM